MTTKMNNTMELNLNELEIVTGGTVGELEDLVHAFFVPVVITESYLQLIVPVQTMVLQRSLRNSLIPHSAFPLTSTWVSAEQVLIPSLTSTLIRQQVRR